MLLISLNYWIVAFICGVILFFCAREYRREIAHDFEFIKLPGELDTVNTVAGFRRVILSEAGNEKISGVFNPGDGERFVIMIHGSGSDGAALLPEAGILNRSQIGTLLIDLPGHGQSDGVVSWGHPDVEAVRSAVGWLLKNQNGAKSIGIYGFSMGAMIAIRSALGDSRIKAVMLAGCMTNTADSFIYQAGGISHFTQYIPWLAANAFRGVEIWTNQPDQIIGRLAGRPVFLLTGSKDETNPAFMSETLFEISSEPKFKLVIDGAGHGDYTRSAPDLFAQALRVFFSRNLKVTTR